ncbi:uncharacterized protein isoform X2 [Leptinotarsa decemlineata]|uniref:uncharacterized protein isoform X2 n=1 Tax=Leptinotarsa decemlineata TaxID=7539 RepID=UPI003D30C252
MGVEGEYCEGPCKILELPHYVLTTLFSYVDSTSLYHLSQTCNYLRDIIEDPSFWRYIDAREEPNTLEKIQYCTNRVHERTTHLLLRGNLNLFGFPIAFFEQIKSFGNITVLALENVKLQGSKVALKDFPPGLEELSLKRTYVKNSTYFFQHSVRNLNKLRVLILDECRWVTCSFILSVSKYEHLEIISIVKCLKVHLDMVPYLNIAKFGCKKLKVFDCRFTGIGGELLRTFYNKEALQRLYFQSFKSAEVDYNEKIIDSESGFKKNPPDPNTAMSISDKHLFEYASKIGKAADEVEKVFDSLLYKDPYPECTCGSIESDEVPSYPEIDFFDDDLVHIPRYKVESSFVCNKHMKDMMSMPTTFKDFFLSQQRQFNPVPEPNLSDSSSDDEEAGSCCYYGMGSSMIIPSTHDRTPSRREEMTLPREGARDQASPRVIVLNPLREGGDLQLELRNSERTSDYNDIHRASTSRSPKQNSNTIKRRHSSSDNDTDSDSDSILNKKARRKEMYDLDGLSSEAQAMIVNQLLETADEVKSRIERIMGENGMPPPVNRQISSDDENENLQENKNVPPKQKASAVSMNNSRTSQNESKEMTSFDDDEDSDSEPEKDRRCWHSKYKTNSTQTKTDSAKITDSGPSCSKTNQTSPSEPQCSRIPVNSANNFGHSSTSTTRANLSNMYEVVDEPSCPEYVNYSDDSQESSSDLSTTDSDSSMINSPPNQKQLVPAELSESPQRIDSPDRNVFIIEHLDRGHQKRKICLRRLSLRGYRRVTDITLGYLANLEIELIDLTFTSVTKKGIENFLVHNPNCRVVHPLYCTCKPEKSLS